MVEHATADVVDALNALYESEQDSIFRVMGERSPYLAKAPDNVRRALEDVRVSTERQGADLIALIRHVGGTPPPGHPPQANEEPMLGLLSLRFLLPKLVDEKSLCIKRYDNALRAIGRAAPPDVAEALRAIQAENSTHRETLQRLADEVIAASR